MTKKANRADINAVAGGAIDAKSEQKVKSMMTRAPESLKDAGREVEKESELRFNTEESTTESNKYPTNINNYYFARGTLSVNPDKGRFVFVDGSNEASRPALTLDKAESAFYSSSRNTTLGTLNVNTIDGYELNQLGATYPSTNYSPTKAWNRQLFPVLPVRGLTSITVLALIQQTLNNLLGGLNSNTTTEPVTRKEDIVTIIVDNQEIEDDLFSEYFD